MSSKIEKLCDQLMNLFLSHGGHASEFNRSTCVFSHGTIGYTTGSDWIMLSGNHYAGEINGHKFRGQTD